MMKLKVEYEKGTKEEQGLIEILSFFFKMKYADDEEPVVYENLDKRELNGKMELILEYHK